MSAKALKSRLVAKLLVSRKKISSGASIKGGREGNCPPYFVLIEGGAPN